MGKDRVQVGSVVGVLEPGPAGGRVTVGAQGAAVVVVVGGDKEYNEKVLL